MIRFTVTSIQRNSGGNSLYNSAFANNVLLEYMEDKRIIKEISPDQTFKPAVKVKMPADIGDGQFKSQDGSATLSFEK